MQGYEFLAGIQRLSLIGQMLEGTPVEEVLSYISSAEAVAPLFDPEMSLRGSERLTALRGFVAKAVEFKRECSAYHDRLSEAERAAGQTRRMLVERSIATSPPATPLGPGNAP